MGRSKITNNKYLEIDGSVIGMYYDPSTYAIFANKDGYINISTRPNGTIYGDTGKYDMEWKNMHDFSKWLNGKGKSYKYIGVDNF